MNARMWPRLRQAVQILALLLFLFLFVYTTAQRPQRLWADLFSRLDPLLMLTASLAGRTLLAGGLLAGIVLVATLLFGRVWCGWICPLGTLLEWIGPRRSVRSPRPAPAEQWRTAKYLLLLALVGAAVLGNLTLLVLDPMTILNRTLAAALWPGLRSAVSQIEAFLYQFPRLWPALDTMHAALVQPLFQQVQPVFALSIPIALLFVGLLTLNLWAERFWCRYLCPLGGLLGLVSRLALVRRKVSDACVRCARCSHRCPTGTINPADNYHSDPAECIVCFDCLAECPGGGVGFRWHLPRWRPAARHGYDPTRRGVVTALGLSAAGVALAGVEPITRRQPATLLRPPGSTLVDFGSLCVRCSACIRTCPTQGLQPSLFEGGVQHLLTPRLVPRLGYCSFGCNACGHVCPTGAIPRLVLEEKQHTVMGLARIDRDRCLPWAYSTPCIVCEETCPVADKAVVLEQVEVTNSEGESVLLQRPQVLKERCIGCGVCEYKCPMGGEAAIRVTAPTQPGG